MTPRSISTLNAHNGKKKETQDVNHSVKEEVNLKIEQYAAILLFFI